MGRAPGLVAVVLAMGCGTKSHEVPGAGRDAEVEPRDAAADPFDAGSPPRDAEVALRDAEVASRDAGPAEPDAAVELDAGVWGELVADFSLEDVNPASATFGQFVSPRQYEGQISAWFFGHAT